MPKKAVSLILSLIMIFSIYSPTLSAGNLIEGKFVETGLQEDGTYKLTWINGKSQKQENYELNKYSILTIDNVAVTIDAFKRGMKIEAEVNEGRIKRLYGYSTASKNYTKIRNENKVRFGLVTRLDPIGKYITILLDSDQTETYFYNGSTFISKGGSKVDISTLFEGDRVKLFFNEYNTNIISSLKIIEQGIQIENVYKGEFHQLDSFNSEVTLKNVQAFNNWAWQSFKGSDTMVLKYNPKEPIYIGNRKVLKKNQNTELKRYKQNEVYFVTIKKFGKEVIEKMVFKNQYERTYYDYMKSIDVTMNRLGFGKSNQIIPYHGGTLLVRNGRLVKDYSLQALQGQLFLVADGPTPMKQYTNVVYVTNDGLRSPNLNGHQLYVGQISNVTDHYQITFSQLQQFNDKWNNVSRFDKKFFYDHDTNAIEEIEKAILDVLPKQENLELYKGKFAYIYVKDNRITNLYILDDENSPEELVSSGKISDIGRKTVNVRNVNRLHGSKWIELGEMENVDVTQTMFMKDGKAISKSDLTIGDRVYVIHNDELKAKVILVY